MEVGKDSYEYAEPKSAVECRERMATLRDIIESIELQLAEKHRTDKRGNRIPPKKYHKWRTQSIRALAAKKEELRYLKRWISAYQQQVHSVKPNPELSGQQQLLLGFYNLIQGKIKSQTCEFTQEELDFYNMARNHILGFPAKV